MTASEKVCYGLALAVLVFGLSGKLANQSGNWPLTAIQRSSHGVARVADSISNHLGTATMRVDNRLNRTQGLAQAKAARVEARAAFANAAMNRRAAERLNAAMARLNAKMARLQALQTAQ